MATPNYGWVLPVVGADLDDWGDILNTAFGDIDTDLKAEETARLAVAASITAMSGMVAPFAMSTAPTGWLKCDGSAVSRATYAALFTAIGTSWGAGNGTTTFNVPDLRGEFVRGYDDGKGTDPARVFASSQADELKAHTHTIPNALLSRGNGGQSATDTTGSGQITGSTGGTETRPRNFALLYCIKT